MGRVLLGFSHGAEAGFLEEKAMVMVVVAVVMMVVKTAMAMAMAMRWHGGGGEDGEGAPPRRAFLEFQSEW
jgi:hypothetical protein